jgi:2',3'-cyclic-nucleotide 2'-phosphodiesterase (5'-nucleotidase family)
VLFLFALLVVFAGAARGEIVRLTVVHTNDVHGGIDRQEATYMNNEFPPRLGGAASMATLLQRLRADVEASGGHFLLVDSGDIFQGTPIGTLSKGRAVIDFMNAAGYDLLALGNHDFDEGKENCMSLVKRAKFPVLAANLIDEEMGKTVPWVESWIIKDFGDLRVGVIGLITPETESMSFPANIAGLEFAPMIPTVREFLPELRRRDVDFVMVVAHAGIPYDPQQYYEAREGGGWYPDDYDRATAMDVAHAVEGIDAIFCGHIHKGFDAAWVQPETHTLLFQTYGRGSGAGIVTFAIDTETNQVVDYDYWTERGYLVTFFEDEFWPEPTVAEMISEESRKAEAGMDRTIGQATGAFTRGGDTEAPMGNAVCDAMCEDSGADFAFTNKGGIRDEFGPGDVTPRHVFRVLPFGNKLVVFQMGGALLREIIEYRIAEDRHGLYIAGGRIVCNMKRPDYDRITSFEIGGEPWHPDSTYQVVTSDFLATGNSGLSMLPEVPAEQKTFLMRTMREAFEAWISRHSPITPRVDGRWVRDDSSQRTPEYEAALKSLHPTP